MNYHLRLTTYALCLICLTPGFVFSQSAGVGINNTGAAADNSAMLDVSATGKGFLIPRIPTANRPANPVESLLIYNTTTQCFEAYNATTSQWVNIACLGCNEVPSAPATGTIVPSATQIAWNWNAVNGATGYKWNTVNDYSTATDNGTNLSYTQTGLTCNTAYTLYVWAYNSCGKSFITILTQTASACPFICGNNLVVTHTSGVNGAPVTKTVTYGTVATSIAGSGTKCWITQNLGADHQASSATDATEASAGWYWQFNRIQGYKHDGTIRTPGTAWDASEDNTYAGWDPAKDPCSLLLGYGWRLPTRLEWLDADGAPQNWNSYNNNYASVLKLHTAGWINLSDGILLVRGDIGVYWSSTKNVSNGNYLYFNDSSSWVGSTNNSYGFSVRCLKD